MLVERMRLRRLGFEGVEADSAEPAGLEPGKCRVLVDESAPAGVDEDRSVLHRLDRSLVDHVAGALEEGYVQCDDVRCPQDLIDGVDPVGFGHLGDGVVGARGHSEGLGDRLHSPGDAGEADGGQARAGAVRDGDAAAGPASRARPSVPQPAAVVFPRRPVLPKPLLPGLAPSRSPTGTPVRSVHLPERTISVSGASDFTSWSMWANAPSATAFELTPG